MIHHIYPVLCHLDIVLHEKYGLYEKNEDRKPTLMVPLCTSACGPCVLGELLACDIWIMNGQVRLASCKTSTHNKNTLAYN